MAPAAAISDIRIRIHVTILPLDRPLVDATFGPSRPRETRSFVVPVAPWWTFDRVGRFVEERYKQCYSEAKLSDWQFKKITTPSPYYDICREDTVQELCGNNDHFLIAVHLASSDRELSLPPGSSLRIGAPRKRTFGDVQPENDEDSADESQRKRSQLDRYGSVVADLHPDQPIPSGEYEQQHQLHPKRSNQIRSPLAFHENAEGFKVPHATQKPAGNAVNHVATQEESSDVAISQDDDLDVPSSQPDLPNNEPVTASGASPADRHSHSSPSVRKTLTQGPAISLVDQSSQSMPVISKPPMKARNSSSTRVTTYLVAFSPNDLNNMRAAARNNVSTPELQKRYFEGLSTEAVTKQYSAIKREVADEKKRQREERAIQDRIRTEEAQGTPSSSDDQAYALSEDDLLIAARLEGADMTRIAKKHFPRRAVQSVVKRAKNLYHDLERAAEKRSPGAKPTKDTMVAAIDTGRSANIELQRRVARESIEDFRRDRRNESEMEEKEVHATEALRARRRQHVENVNNKVAFALAEEFRKKTEEDLTRRRAIEDTENHREHQKKVAEWQVAVVEARKAHRTLPKEPKPPPASTIGLEITSSRNLGKRSSSQRESLDDWVDKGSKVNKTARTTQTVAGPPSTAPNKLGGLATPKTSPRHTTSVERAQTDAMRTAILGKSKPAPYIRDDESVISIPAEEYTMRRALTQLGKDRPKDQPLSSADATATGTQSQNGPSNATRSKTTPSKTKITPNEKNSQANKKSQKQVVSTSKHGAVSKQAKKAIAMTKTLTPTKGSSEVTCQARSKSTRSATVPPKTSHKTAAVTMSRTKQSAVQDGPNAQLLREMSGIPLGEQMVDLSSSEDEDEDEDEDGEEDDICRPGARSDSGSEYSLSNLPGSAEKRRWKARRAAEIAIKEHDARGREEYTAIQARMAAKEEARRSVGDPCLNDIYGEQDTADEEIERYLDGIPPRSSGSSHVLAKPTAPVRPAEPTRRNAAGIAKLSQSTLGSARPPFPSSGRVRSTSASSKSRPNIETIRKTSTNAQPVRLNATEQAKEDAIRAEHERQKDAIRQRFADKTFLYQARINDDVNDWRKEVERAGIEKV